MNESMPKVCFTPNGRLSERFQSQILPIRTHDITDLLPGEFPLGHRLSLRMTIKYPEKFMAGLGVVEGSVVLTVAVYVIIDMEYPRVGLIQIDKFDQALMEVRASMK